MSIFFLALIGLLSLFITSTSGSKCPRETINGLVVCYYKSETSINNLNVCNCTHVVFTNAIKKSENYSLDFTEEAGKDLSIIKDQKDDLVAIFTYETKPEESSGILKSENRSRQLVEEISNLLQDSHFDGIELNFKFEPTDGISKDSYASFVKDLSKSLSSRHKRVKRNGYGVFEKLQDDVTTASYSTLSPKNTTSKAPSLLKSRNGKPRKVHRKTREEKEIGDADEENDEKKESVVEEETVTKEPSNETTEKLNTLKDVEEKTDTEKEHSFLIFVRLSIQPEIIAKKFDLKALSKYANILTVPTHNIVNKNEDHLTYHPSRLMGLADILNTDSILDFLTGLGAVKSKMVISMPATVLKFQLKDSSKNTPRSPSASEPEIIDQSELCSLFRKNNWTLERDEDLTAPYAFSGKTWLALEDEISINIKGKYILLRELAGGAIYPIDADVNDQSCTNHTGTGGYLTSILYRNFRSLGRKPRALVLESLQEEIHGNSYSNIEADVKLSEYRIVRVVDHDGAVHVIRKNTKTRFECSRQGYFSHPLGCNKFYRCVKFDQYSDEYTVFEYDCPAGLAFDERWEVCVWPGSLPNGAPCTGSSEIAPVPRSHYQCPNQEGYYADPENCRWFFACMDHARDGRTPLTAYEFRCPFGLVFNEQRLACDWPWIVGACGNRGVGGYINVESGGASSGIHTTTFVNGGNLEASYGQYNNLGQEASFDSFGKGFGTVLKGAGTGGAGAGVGGVGVGAGIGAGAGVGYGSGSGSGEPFPGTHSAGFGYIASQFDNDQNRASFATLPDYEISGGRVLNKGGLVYDQGINVVGVSGGASGAGVDVHNGFNSEDFNRQTIYTGSSRGSFGASGSESYGGSGKGTYGATGRGSFGASGAGGFGATDAGIYGVSDAGSYGTGGARSFGSSGVGSFDARGSGSHEASGTGRFGENGRGSFGAAGREYEARKLEKLQPVAVIPTGTLVGSSKGLANVGQSSFQHSISTAKPFVIAVPSVQVNEAKISGYSGNSIAGSVGSQSSGFGGAAHGGSVHVQSGAGHFGEGHSVTQQQFTVTQPTVTVEVPVVTPKPGATLHTVSENTGYSGGIADNQPSVLVGNAVVTNPQTLHRSSSVGHGSLGSVTDNQPKITVGVTPISVVDTFEHGTSGQSGGISLGTPTVSYGVPSSTPKIETHRFEQSSFKQGGLFGGVSVNQPDSFVTPKPGGFGFTPSGQSLFFGNAGIGQSGYSRGVPVNQPAVSVQPTVTPKPIVPSIDVSSGGFGGQANINIQQRPVSIEVTSQPFGYSSGGFSGSSKSVSASQPLLTQNTRVQSFDFASSGEQLIGPKSVSGGVPVQTHSFGQQVFSGQSVISTKGSQIGHGSESGSIGQSGVTYGVPTVTAKPGVLTYQQTGSFGGKFEQSSVSGGGVVGQAIVPVVSVVSPKPTVFTYEQSGSFGSKPGGSGVSGTVSQPGPVHTFEESDDVGTNAVQNGFSISQPRVTYGVPTNTAKPSVHTFQQTGGFGGKYDQGSISGGVIVSQPVVPVVPAVTPKPAIFSHQQSGSFGGKTGVSGISGIVSVTQPGAVHTFEQSRSYGSKNIISEEVSINQPVVPVVTPKPTIFTNEFSDSLGTKTGKSSISISQPVVTYGVSTVTPKPAIHTFQQTETFKQGSGSIDISQPVLGVSVNQPATTIITPRPTLFTSQHSGNFESNSGSSGSVSIVSSTVAPQPAIHTIEQTKITRPPAISVVPVVTPKPAVFSFGQSGSSGSGFSSTVSPKTEIHTFQQTNLEGNAFGGEVTIKQPSVSYLPAVTPSTEIHTFGQNPFSEGVSGGKSTVLLETPVTLKTELHTTKYQTEGVSGTPKVSLGLPVVTSKPVVTSINTDQTNQISGGFSSVSFKFPKTEIHTFGKNTGFQGEQLTISQPEISFNVPEKTELHTFGQSHGFVKSQNNFQTNRIVQPVQAFGQGLSHSSGFVKSEFGSAPRPNTFIKTGEKTTVTVEKQPIFSVGTLPPTTLGFEGPTTSYQGSNDKINFKSSFKTVKPVRITKPSTLVSVTPSSILTQDVQIGKTQTVNIQPIGVSTPAPAIQETFVNIPSFDQKTVKQTTFNQPAVQVSTGRPFGYQEEVVSPVPTKTVQKTNVYLPPVTNKIEVFKPKAQVTTPRVTYSESFRTGQNEQVVFQKQPIAGPFEFIQTKQTGGSVSTFGQGKYQETISIGKGLTQDNLGAITKSAELNPTQFFQTTTQYLPSQPTTVHPVVDQQQLHVVSQKNFGNKNVIQPFYEIGKEVNTITDSGQQDYNSQQQINFKGTNSYLPPPSSYSSTKTTISGSTVYSGEGVTPVVPTSGSLEGTVGSVVTEIKTNEYLPPIVNIPSKVISIQPQVTQQEVHIPKVSVTTEVPIQYLTPKTEEVTIQQHANFDFQKVKTGNSYIQPQAISTIAPDTSGGVFQFNTNSNFSAGHSVFSSGPKYSINPNIEIPQPPEEYLLTQNVYSTSRPKTSGRKSSRYRAGQFKSTTEPSIEGNAYIPPRNEYQGGGSRRRPSSKTVVSVGSVDKQEDNIQQLLDKYSDGFGEVIKGDNEKFITKVIDEDSRGNVGYNKVEASTVQYEVTIGGSKQRGRGRKYHGGITSNLPATNKYEEYDIDTEKERSRSRDGSSKTTIDLKNLNVDKDKKTVIVVSQVSDANPILVGKLAGQCSCQSNMLEIKKKGRKSSWRDKNRKPQGLDREYLPTEAPGDNLAIEAVTHGGLPSANAISETVLIGGSNLESSSPGSVYSSSTIYPEISSPSILSSLSPDGVLSITPKALFDEKVGQRKKQFRGKTRYLPPGNGFVEGSSVVLASDIASTVDYAVYKEDYSRNQNEIDGRGSAGNSKLLAGAAYDRYGPGGWRGFDETLQGSVDCKRPGLFRHPKHCNKFYACNWDPWTERYTLHVFNCPIRLTYDSSISACNWPVKGPACADDNLLV